MSRKHRRLCVRLAACLLAGCVVALGVAWFCAYYRFRPRFDPDSGPGVAAKGWLWDAPGFPPPTMRIAANAIGVSSMSVSDAEQSQGGTLIRHSMSRFEAGLPFRAFSAVEMMPSADLPPPMQGFAYLSLRRGFRGVVPVGGGVVRAVWLPTQPLWPGLAADALVYSALIFAVTLLWKGGRAGLLRSRGLCPQCGYDLTGAPSGKCPECGRVGAAATRGAADTPSQAAGQPARHVPPATTPAARRISFVVHGLLVVFSLIAGAIVTCLLVALLVLMVRYSTPPYIQRVVVERRDTPPFVVFTAFGSEYVMPITEDLEATYVGQDTIHSVRTSLATDWSNRLSWSRALRCVGNPNLISYEEGRGWPFKALRSYISTNLDVPNPHPTQYGAFGLTKASEARWIATNGTARTLSPIYVAFPSEIVPLGFAADSLVFGACVYGLILLVRRWAMPERATSPT